MRLLVLLLLSGCIRNVILGRTYPPTSVVPSDATAADDGNASMQPSLPTGCVAQTERCNGVDDSCDGSIDEGCDDDGDGACDASMVTEMGATCAVAGDCRDEGLFADLLSPAFTEICGDGLDNDCNGLFDEQEALCPALLLQRVFPLQGTVRWAHNLPFLFDVAIAPPNALTRTFSVSSASGGPACAVSDIVDIAAPTDDPSRHARTLALDAALASDASRVGCRYTVELRVGSHHVTSVDITFVNTAPHMVSLQPARPTASGFEVWFPAGGGTLYPNAADAELDSPVSYRWTDTSGVTTCAPSCVQDTLAVAGPTGDYVIGLDAIDTLGASSHSEIVVHIAPCVWASAGATGDGSSAQDALGSLGAALALGAATSRGVCLAGSGTFNENVSIPAQVPHLMGGFDGTGVESTDRPSIVVQTAPLTAATGFTGMLRRVSLASVSSPTVVVTDTLHLDDVELRAASVGAEVYGKLTMTRSFAMLAAPTADPTLFRVLGASAQLTLIDSGIQLFPCSGTCRCVQSSGAAHVALRRLSLEASSSGSVVVVDAVGGSSELIVEDNRGWTINAAQSARAVSAPSGANAWVRNNESFDVSASNGQSAIALHFGAGGHVDISGNRALSASADGVEAVAIDLVGVTGAVVSNNGTIRASASNGYASSAETAAAIRLRNTQDVSITGNDAIFVLGAGRSLSAGISDGSVSRLGELTLGGSARLTIADNGSIRGGDATLSPMPQDCSLSVTPDATDISVGVLLVGSASPRIERNGRPQRSDGGIASGHNRPYWDAALRPLPPMTVGLWLVATRDALVKDNELRGGEIDLLADASCLLPSAFPTSIGLLDGLPESALRAASDGSQSLRVSGNGIDCAHRPDGFAREPERCVGVWLSAPSGVRVDNNTIAASEGKALVAFVQERGFGVDLMHNLMALDVAAPQGTAYSKTMLSLSQTTGLSVVGNVWRVTAASGATDSVTLVAGDMSGQLWGNLIDVDAPLSWVLPAWVGAAHNRAGRSAFLDFASVWQRSLARMPATSDALDFAPRFAGDVTTDIDGDARTDASPDAGPDELVRAPSSN